ncbi:hypothetical protein [Bradyrhizobium sp. STM 3562]|uniref:hypothetical protein n=1 Tax=Bradyrhizobium sp. STM 3562 TaxID=578924 RepID=UPI00388F66EB
MSLATKRRIVPTALHAGAISIRVEVAAELSASSIWHVRLLTWTVFKMVHAQDASAWRGHAASAVRGNRMVAGVPRIRAKKVRYCDRRRFAERIAVAPDRASCERSRNHSWSSLKPIASNSALSTEAPRAD